MIVSNMQIYKGSLAAFEVEASNECHLRAVIDSTLIANIPAVKYSVIITSISTISRIPCVLSILIGSAYAQDTASIMNLAAKQKDVVDRIKLTLGEERTWIDDSMVTTGEGFSITESEII